MPRPSWCSKVASLIFKVPGHSLIQPSRQHRRPCRSHIVRMRRMYSSRPSLVSRLQISLPSLSFRIAELFFCFDLSNISASLSSSVFFHRHFLLVPRYLWTDHPMRPCRRGFRMHWIDRDLPSFWRSPPFHNRIASIAYPKVQKLITRRTQSRYICWKDHFKNP